MKWTQCGDCRGGVEVEEGRRVINGDGKNKEKKQNEVDFGSYHQHPEDERP